MEKQFTAKLIIWQKMDDGVIPIEVKSGQAAHMKSLQYFLKKHSNSPYGICLSPSLYEKKERVMCYPLYAIGVVFHSSRIKRFCENL